MSYVKKRKRSSTHSSLPYNVSLGAALLAGGFASGAAAADGADQASTTKLDPITVQGEELDVVGDYKQESLASPKFTQPLSETTQTVQIISEDLIEDQRATTLTEALRNSPGVGTFSMGENGASNTGDAIYIRGVDSSSAIYVDGVRDIGSVHRDTFNTAQVEVIKGSNGANFGRTSPGGSINLVTKKARSGDFGEVSLSVGTDGQRRTTFDINRQFNDTSAFRLNLMWQNSDVPGRNLAENNRWGIAPALSFGLGTDTRIHLNYLHVNQDNVPDGGVPTVGLPGWSSPGKDKFDGAPQPDSENFYGTAEDYEDVQIDRATVIFEQDFGNDGTFRNLTRWTRIEQEYLLTAPYIGDTDGWVVNDLSTYDLYPIANQKNQTHQVFTNQSGIVQKLEIAGLQHQLSYGLVLSREQLDDTGMEVSGYPTSVNIYDPQHDSSVSVSKTGEESESTVDTAAVYLFDTVELSKSWEVTAGLRLDHYAIEYNATNAPDADIEENLFSWQLGTLYKINEYGNIYANYAVSAQPPGGNSLQLNTEGFFADYSPNSTKYEPQEAKTAELGTKWELADERLLLSAAVYRTKIENQVVADGPGDYAQVGEKIVKGFELTAVGRITPRWNVNAGFMILDATMEGGTDGKQAVPYAPTEAFTSWTTYRLPNGLTLGGGIRYMGELETSRSGPNAPSTVDDYWVVDAMANYALSRNLDLQLNVYNVLDEEYVSSINAVGVRYTPGQPRTAVVSLNYQF